MKYLLAFFLFSSTSLPQGVVFNTPTDSIYVIDFNTTPIEILNIHESTVIPIVCLNNESKKISEVKFSTSPNCLVQSLNSAFNLHIDQYVDMKKNFTKDEIKQIVKEKRMSQVFSLIQYTSTSYSLFELADLYSKVKSKNFKYKFIYPTFLVIEDELIPISA